MNTGGITFYNSTAECPRCGTQNAIPDGHYEFVGGVLASIRALPPDTIRALADLVRAGRARGQSYEELAEALCRQAPALRKFVPQDAAQLASYLSALVALLAVLLSRCDDAPRTAVNVDQITIQQTIQVLEQQNYDVDTIVKNALPDAELQKLIEAERQKQVHRAKMKRKRERRAMRGK
jgi:hypothetical protein